MVTKTATNIRKTLEAFNNFKALLHKCLIYKNKELSKHKKDADENIELAESLFQEKQELSEKLHQAELKANSLEEILCAKSIKTECILQTPSVSEKYPGEFIFALMSAIHYAVDPLNQTGGKGKKSSSAAIRAQTVWNEFIKCNPDGETKYKSFNECIDKILSAARQGELTRNASLLKPFHMKFSANTNNHYELHFDDCDDLYSATSGCTPSDMRSQLNSCRDIKNTFFF